MFNNTASGISDININQPCSINGTATFTNGVVNFPGSGSLSFGTSASSNIGNANSYVNGVISKIGTSAFNFATGEGEHWGPCAIAAPFLNSTITAQYVRDAGPLDGCTYVFQVQTCTSLVSWTWYTSDTSPPNVTLYWNANSGVFNLVIWLYHILIYLQIWENKVLQIFSNASSEV